MFDVFRNKRIFLTGHTGFKGSWLALWLEHLGAKVTGYSLPAPTAPSNFEASGVEKVVAKHIIGDIRDAKTLERAVNEADPEILFHLAAQPLVRLSYLEPRDTWETNVIGTAGVLDAVRRRSKPCVVVVISSDKCYENKEQVWGYRECDPMGGYDPYSASKGATELVVASYARSFFPPAKLSAHGVKLASARAGNVIGGGDWAKDRIVTDIVSALAEGRPVPVRNRHAIRPWQHVLEPLSGYLTLAARMLSSDDARWCAGWNFGPMTGHECPVLDLVKLFCQVWGDGKWEDKTDANAPHEAVILRLSIEKAMTELQWKPQWDLPTTVRRTAEWYRQFYTKRGPMRDACLADITQYEASMSGIK